jgi:hypothetical protein
MGVSHLNREILMKKMIFVCFLTVAVASQAFSDEIDDVMELLAAERGGEILYLSKVNLGIPGGDTWIADRRDEWAYIYFIDSDKKVSVVKRGNRTFAEPSKIMYMDQSTYSRVNLDFDIMRDIPGTRIGNKAATFGDFNGDGRDEIFDFYNTESLCTISGYNSDKDTMESYFGCHYDIINPKGPSPVEFINNQGVYSIKVSLWDLREKQYVWVFWAWDEESSKYVQYARINESEIRNSDTEDNIRSVQPILAEQNTGELAEDRSVQEETAFAPPDSEKKSGFNLYIVIISAIAVLAAAAIFIIEKKKKK